MSTQVPESGVRNTKQEVILGAESGVRSPGSGVQADRVSPSPSRPGERVPAGNPESGGRFFFTWESPESRVRGARKKQVPLVRVKR
eukprot:scaffold45386_cov42-Phaeocystis_antarctica.AAC.1